MSASKRIRKIVLVLLGVLLLLGGLIMALSPVAKYVVNNYGQQLVGRDMHVDKVFINPFAGVSVTLTNFELKEQNRITDFAAFDRLYVRVNVFALMHHEVDVRKTSLEGFTAIVMRSNDRFNFTDIIEHFRRHLFGETGKRQEIK